MLKTIRLAMQYKDSLPLAVDSIKQIEISIRDDGSISQKERSKILKSFWALVKSLQEPRKVAAKIADQKTKFLVESKSP